MQTRDYRNPQSAIRNPQSENPQSAIRNPQSSNPQSAIRNPQLGRGGPDMDLDSAAMRAVVQETFAAYSLGRRVLAIVPDKTRDDPTDVLFPILCKELPPSVERIDVLIAQGTHPPMTDAEKRAKIGLSHERSSLPRLGIIFDHHWDDPAHLVSIGRLSAARVREITGGLFAESIDLRINRLLGPGVYDTVFVIGGTTPHEVAGFSGGTKYFFPGVGGPDVTHATHWVGALATIEHTIGRVDTPIRRLLDEVASFVPLQVISFNSVSNRTDEGRLRSHALFTGDITQAFRRATEVSAQVHIQYMPRRFCQVVALLDPHYDEMWTGGKASYRLGAVIEPGGELLIYAPHLRTVSKTHGKLIRKYGYHVLDRVREWVERNEDLRENLCVAAHLTHVRYAGEWKNGIETPRFHITLASQVPESECRQVNLGYLDPAGFDPTRYQDSDSVIVENAGRDLYLCNGG
ncbi:MAG TPA: lactate racemase domain-containing protein [Acidobacteriota bacterium]|nr:lactate racemase domain-containing protein [Acidobacteriota bacterium]